MSAILEQWREGKGLPDLLVIDGHTHIGEWPHGANVRTAEEATDEAVAYMDAYGVDAACVLSGGYMANGVDYRLGNDILLECVGRAPERLIPFAHINPNDSLTSITAELERMHAAGVRAVKLLNAYQGYPGDGPNLWALYDYCHAQSMLILNHHWTEGELRQITTRFPGATFIRGHGGASALSHELPGAYDNIWGLWPLGVVESGIRRYGPEKILFGSDAFMNDLSVGLGMVVYAGIPDKHKRMVLGLNMARLLDCAGALPASLKRWL